MVAVLPPITPSVSGRAVTFDQTAPVYNPTDSILTAVGSRSQCSAHGLPDGRVAWLISQEDSVYPKKPADGYVTDPGTRSNSNGEGSLWFGYAPDETTFLTQDDSVTSVKCLLEITNHSSIGDRTHHDGTLFMVPGDTDNLWLVWRLIRLRQEAVINPHADFPVPDADDGDAMDPQKFFGGVFLYKSTDWGATWTHYSTLSQRYESTTSSVLAKSPPSYPYFHTPSMWYIAGDYMPTLSETPGPVADHTIYRTNSAGSSWTTTYFLDGSNSAGSGKTMSRNLSHSKGVGGDWFIKATLSGIDSQNFNSLIATSPGSTSWSEVDNQVDTPYGGFETRGAQAVVWDDNANGTAHGLFMDAEPNSAVGVNNGLHYVTAPPGWSYNHSYSDVIVSQFQFDNWPEDSGGPDRQTFLISPGHDYYLVSCQRWVMGIRGTACPQPRPLRIPHKLWGYDQDKERKKELKERAETASDKRQIRVASTDWQFTDNWTEIERWAHEANKVGNCRLHIPKKLEATKRGDKANYNALRRWVENGCLCCVAASRHYLPERKRGWTHADMMQHIERWSDDVRLNCAQADP